MNKTLLTIIVCAIAFGACRGEFPCGAKPCNKVFAFISLKFTKNDGTGVEVTNFSVVNQRTGSTLDRVGSSDFEPGSGMYTIATDRHLKDLSAKGDDLKITATYEGQTKSAIVKVSGGGCACHIKKVSG